MSFPPASMLSDGFFLSLSLCLDIGLVNVAMLSLTLSHGFRPGFWLGLGSCVGDLVYAALALAGMAVLLQFEAVRWIVWIGGGAYTGYAGATGIPMPTPIDTWACAALAAPRPSAAAAMNGMSFFTSILLLER